MARFQTLSAAVALGLSLGAFAAIGPVTDLEITDAFVSPDGPGLGREAVLAGGTFPGPLIQGNKGDNFQINVVNNLTNHTMLKTTSIHWHGLFQHGTTWADGPAFVSQCPIASGNSFLYNFNVPDQAGTFWYHSHLATQYCDGLRGPLVVYDPNDPHADLYDVDDESTVITLSDWYHAAASTLTFPTFDTTLINGLGRFAGTGGSDSNLTVITVEQGKRYRFRLVSISCDPNWVFSIDQHELTVIEVDGVNAVPLTVDAIQIFAAQRYSFVLNANQTVDNYWIRANPNNGNMGFANGINSAILRYVGADDVEPTSTGTTANLLNEADLSPLVPAAAPGAPNQDFDAVDVPMNLNFTFNGTNLFINGATFVPPSVPVLTQILSGAMTAQELLPAGSVYTLPRNATVQLSLPGNIIAGPHPFHLHGHTFSVIRSAGQSDYNYVDPIQRDVVSIGGATDNVTIRFTTDNPGPWFFHCHIDWHLQAGFAIVFAEETADVASANPVPADWSALCPTYDALSDADH
ncbi:laccase precursor [Gelatoporia subvermispora B]|uniref:laccase n=2 Tax=Ceriporiopsis subvermispora TaxID=42742 RepID=M2QK38_CERS8|nr:laccase precursor [Gelatoporia subvermispora]AAO25685.1 Lcs-1 [Gelatoporia subvermispora]AAO26040.1 laccase 1 [Gelatoporia subvermispora]EMD32465.1 laccase precursor [Gelatoporia subvermispora B]